MPWYVDQLCIQQCTLVLHIIYIYELLLYCYPDTHDSHLGEPWMSLWAFDNSDLPVFCCMTWLEEFMVTRNLSEHDNHPWLTQNLVQIIESSWIQQTSTSLQQPTARPKWSLFRPIASRPLVSIRSLPPDAMAPKWQLVLPPSAPKMTGSHLQWRPVQNMARIQHREASIIFYLKCSENQ